MIRGAAERETVNMPIQGTAADVLKKAMIDVHAALEACNAGRRTPTRMILTVHDELLFEAPEEDAERGRRPRPRRMETAFPLNVPLDRRRRHRQELDRSETVGRHCDVQSWRDGLQPHGGGGTGALAGARKQAREP